MLALGGSRGNENCGYGRARRDARRQGNCQTPVGATRAAGRELWLRGMLARPMAPGWQDPGADDAEWPKARQMPPRSGFELGQMLRHG